MTTDDPVVPTQAQHLPDTGEWLEQHVPLTLLIDLAAQPAPDSAAILAAEPADTSWLVSRTSTSRRESPAD